MDYRRRGRIAFLLSIFEGLLISCRGDNRASLAIEVDNILKVTRNGASPTPICRHLGRDLVPQHHICDWDNEFPKKVDFGNQDRVDGGMRNQPHFFYADA
jgi:hypothetical protein